MEVTFIFLMVVLKLPIVALLWIVWWAVRSTPDPEQGSEGDGGSKHPRQPRPPRPRTPRPRGPHGDPPMPPPARARTAAARGRRIGA
jgi:hypothetical protein